MAFLRRNIRGLVLPPRSIVSWFRLRYTRDRLGVSYRTMTGVSFDIFLFSSKCCIAHFLKFFLCTHPRRRLRLLHIQSHQWEIEPSFWLPSSSRFLFKTGYETETYLKANNVKNLIRIWMRFIESAFNCHWNWIIVGLVYDKLYLFWSKPWK